MLCYIKDFMKCIIKSIFYSKVMIVTFQDTCNVK